MPSFEQFREQLNIVIGEVGERQLRHLFDSTHGDVSIAVNHFFNQGEDVDMLLLPPPPPQPAADALADPAPSQLPSIPAERPVIQLAPPAAAPGRPKPAKKRKVPLAPKKRAVAARKRALPASSSDDSEEDEDVSSESDVDLSSEDDDDLESIPHPQSPKGAGRRKPVAKRPKREAIPTRPRPKPAAPRKKKPVKVVEPRTETLELNTRGNGNVLTIPGEVFDRTIMFRSLWRVGTKVHFNVEDGTIAWVRATIRRMRLDSQDATYHYDLELDDEFDHLCPTMQGVRPLHTLPVVCSAARLRPASDEASDLILPGSVLHRGWKHSNFLSTLASYRASARSNSAYVPPPEKKKPKSSSVSVRTQLEQIKSERTVTAGIRLLAEELPECWRYQLIGMEEAAIAENKIARGCGAVKFDCDLAFLLAATKAYRVRQLVDVCVGEKWMAGVVEAISMDRGVTVSLLDTAVATRHLVPWARFVHDLYPVIGQHALLDMAPWIERRNGLNVALNTAMSTYYQPMVGVQQNQPRVIMEIDDGDDEEDRGIVEDLVPKEVDAAGWIGQLKFVVVTDQRYVDGMSKAASKAWSQCLFAGESTLDRELLRRFKSIRTHLPPFDIRILPPAAGCEPAMARDYFDHNDCEEGRDFRARFYDNVCDTVAQYYQREEVALKLKTGESVPRPSWDELNVAPVVTAPPNDARGHQARAARRAGTSVCDFCEFRHDDRRAQVWRPHYEATCPIEHSVPMVTYEITWKVRTDDLLELNDRELILQCLYPEVEREFRRVQAKFIVDMQFPLPLDQLQRLSVQYHANQADFWQPFLALKEAGEAISDEMRVRYAPLTDLDELSLEEMNERCGIVAERTIKDYQAQTIRWMYRKEYDFGDATLNTSNNINAPFWRHVVMCDGSTMWYSPFFNKIQRNPPPDLKGGWVCEEQGLGKTIEMISLINCTLDRAKDTIAMKPTQYTPALLEPEELQLQRIPRDREGRYYSAATLILCPVNLIGQWIDEIQKRSTRPLRVLEFHSKEVRMTVDELLEYDVIITSYSMLPGQLNAANANYEMESLVAPWALQKVGSVKYMNPLFRIHWHRIVLDESHLMKNAAASIFKATESLFSQRRWLMSGTAFNGSIMDLRPQCKFLNIQDLDFAFFERWFAPLLIKAKNGAQVGFRDGTISSESDSDDMSSDEDDPAAHLRGLSYSVRMQRLQARQRRLRRRAGAEGNQNLLPAQCLDKRLLAGARSMDELFPDFAADAPADDIESVEKARLTAIFSDVNGKQRENAVVNTIFTIACKSMMRHEKVQEYLGRSNLIELPPKVEETVWLDMTEHQQAVYNTALKIAQTRYKELKDRGMAVRKALEITQVLRPLREVCSSGWMDEAANEAELKRVEAIIKEMIHNPQAALNLLPALNAVDDDCPICMCQMEDPVQTPCRHLFCKGCLTDWRHKTCPMCRAPFEWNQISQPVVAAAAAPAVEEEEAVVGLPEEAAAAVAAANADAVMRDVDAPVLDLSRAFTARSPNDVLFDAKLVRLVQELREMRRADPDAKALVFTQFAGTFGLIKKALAFVGIRAASLEGSMTLPQRKRALSAFINDPTITVFILNTRTGGVGLTLVVASYLFIMDPCLNPAIELQATRRVHRLGQKKPVQIKYLLMKKSVDGIIYRLSRERMQGAVQAVDARENEADNNAGGRRGGQANRGNAPEASTLHSADMDKLFGDNDGTLDV